jgi:hypothetical protein
MQGHNQFMKVTSRDRYPRAEVDIKSVLVILDRDLEMKHNTYQPGFESWIIETFECVTTYFCSSPDPSQS